MAQLIRVRDAATAAELERLLTQVNAWIKEICEDPTFLLPTVTVQENVGQAFHQAALHVRLFDLEQFAAAIREVK